MKRYVPIAFGGLAFLLTSCASPGSGPLPTSTTTTTTTSTSTTVSDAAKSDDGSKSDDAAKSEKSDASDESKTDSTEKADASSGSEDSDSASSARNLYVEQLKKPDSKMNTGVVYWLELNRDGKKSHVTNKMQFQEGDQLRIHIKPNIVCYSYILLLQGSKGDKSVLFPSEDLPDNKLKAGKEVILPVAKGGEEAWMKFDDHPGTEVVRVIVSRKKIDPEKELPGGESSTVAIASARGDDDNVPDGTAATIVGDDAKATRNLTVVTKSKHPDEEGQVTVVGKSGEKSLRVDIAMDHREAKTE